MIPPKWDVDIWLTYQQKVADNFVEAIQQNKIENIVVLSSIGAHMGNGAGPVDGLAYLESKLNGLSNLNATYLRPSYFYTNLLSMIPMLKNAGIMGSNLPASFKIVLVHPADIAKVASEQLQKLSSGKKIVYISSDERTLAEVVEAFAKATGKEHIPWIEFTDEQSENGMLQAGLPPTLASGYATLGAALRSGEMQSDYFKNQPVIGRIKLEEFAEEFGKAYNAG